jgi:hypothetical protein
LKGRKPILIDLANEKERKSAAFLNNSWEQSRNAEEKESEK